MKNDRREFIKKGTTLAAMSVVGMGSASAGIRGLDSNSDQSKKPTQKKVKWPVKESADTPKLCMPASFTADVKAMRRIKQIGIAYVLMGGPKIPWKEEDLRAAMDRFKAQGLTIINMMFGGINNTILGREGRDEEIENVKKSLIAAGAVGLPVVEYNFYVH